MLQYICRGLCLLLVVTSSLPLIAQSENYETDIEDLLYKEEEAYEKKSERKKDSSYRFEQIDSLKYLAPFQDIAIIQRKLLPKTSRWEAFPSVGVILNDAFFTNQIFSMRVGYHLNESYAFELVYAGLTQAEKQVTSDLEEFLSVFTSSIVVPQSYTGLDFRWTPYYGKMAYLDSSIIPYETYFSLGLGQTTTNQELAPMTLHAGIGQHFALNKSISVRWDTSFYWYRAKSADAVAESLYTNIHFTIGASFFFPGVN